MNAQSKTRTQSALKDIFSGTSGQKRKLGDTSRFGAKSVGDGQFGFGDTRQN